MSDASNAELITTAAQQDLAVSSEELRGRLASLLGRSADDLREMAAIVAELERRGEDLSALRLGLVDHLRRIAAGQLLPEVLVKFAGFPALLRIATHLPLLDQGKLISGEPLQLAVWRGDRVEWRKVDPLALTGPQIGQVFQRDRIRTEAEQVSVLESRRERAAREPQRDADARRVRPDRQRDGVMVGRVFAPTAEVLAALCELRPETDESDRSSTLVVKLTDDEHRRLKVKAAESGRSIQDIARAALRLAGLL